MHRSLLIRLAPLALTLWVAGFFLFLSTDVDRVAYLKNANGWCLLYRPNIIESLGRQGWSLE